MQRAAFGKSGFPEGKEAGTLQEQLPVDVDAPFSQQGTLHPSPQPQLCASKATQLRPEVSLCLAHLYPAALGGGNPSDSPGKRELLDFLEHLRFPERSERVVQSKVAI